MTTAESRPTLDFIRQIVADDLAAGRHGGRVVTRFPPEPNGFLHIGHAKSICLNFGIGAENQHAPRGSRCNLRFDDTNPTKEEQKYIDAIKEDVRWLGFDWGEHEYYASNCFEQLYLWAVQLIKQGDAYVDDLSMDEIREYRGTLTAPGRDSPHRNRSVEENLDLFERMKSGEFPNGVRVLRAKIDMASPNVNLRDPVLYRILHAAHPRTGDKWCIYPMYDWAHGQCDAIEGVTHSICTMEFENHRPLYDWCLQRLGFDEDTRPHQYEFARLNLTYTMMSKRKLLELVREGHVSGWDDPRMPTIRGMRRRGYSPQAIRHFCEGVGVAKRDNVIEVARLEEAVRDDLNKTALRVMAVLDPLRVVITNYPEGQVEQMDAVNNPEDPAAGTRKAPFSRVLYIERSDFMENPPRKFYRLAPGVEVRLRYGYLVTCTDVVKDDAGNVVELHCTYDPGTCGGDTPDGRKVRGTIHWVSAAQSLPVELRLYDHLFNQPDPEKVDEGRDWRDNLNPDSRQIVTAHIEPSVAAGLEPGTRYQFERIGYFCVDPDSTADKIVFNRTIGLRDTWAKVQQKQ